MGTLKIERVGGLAGFGLPQSRVKSSGEQALSALSAADRATVESLFHAPTEQLRPDGQTRDGFRYKLTRSVDGREQTVEVPEAAVPPALKDCVTDKLL